jgi:DNA invertase Pin-like site-specific DNA recombinase
MNNNFKDLRVATYHWEYNGGDEAFEGKYHVGIMDKERLEEYCAEHSIVPVFKLVEDSPHSPEDYDNRPVLKELFELAENEQIDVVLINRMYIFSGSIRGFIKEVWKLQNLGVTVQCVDEPFTTYVNDGRLIILPEESKY